MTSNHCVLYQVLGSTDVRDVLSLMYSCGMYDYRCGQITWPTITSLNSGQVYTVGQVIGPQLHSGEFAFEVRTEYFAI